MLLYFVPLALVLSFLVVFILIPTILRVSHSKRFYDEPGGRRVHKNSVPTLGGVAIFFSVLLFYSIFLEITGQIIVPYLIPALLIIFFIGVKDDILVTAPVVKLLGQITAASVIVIAGDLRFTHFYSLIPAQPEYLLTLFLSVFFIIFIVNGFNLIDGIDGLAGVTAIISLLVFTVWFAINQQYPMAFLGAAIIGSLIGFLYYNFQKGKNKIFMGDTGSLTIGFLVAVFTIRFLEVNSGSTGDPLVFRIQAGPGMALAIIILPVVDTIRVFFRRILQGRSPFSADKTHIHHRLLTLGFSHIQVVILLGSFNLAFILVAYLLRNLGVFYLLTINLTLGFLLLQVPSLSIRRRKRLMRQRVKAA